MNRDFPILYVARCNKLEWGLLLTEHPHTELVQFFILGISNGFHIGCKPPKLQAGKNMESAYAHKEVVDNCLQAEVSIARVSGPFAWSVVLNGQISRFGVIPKHHKPDSWQLIIDSSHLHNHSINDGITSSLFSIKYITIDDATKLILSLRKGIIMAKVNIKNVS